MKAVLHTKGTQIHQIAPELDRLRRFKGMPPPLQANKQTNKLGTRSIARIMMGTNQQWLIRTFLRLKFL